MIFFLFRSVSSVSLSILSVMAIDSIYLVCTQSIHVFGFNSISVPFAMSLGRRYILLHTNYSSSVFRSLAYSLDNLCRYCSSSYPNVEPKEWRCEWCVHDHEKRRRSDGHKPSKAVAAAVEGVQGGGGGSSSGEETNTVIRFTRKRPRSDGAGDVEKRPLRVATSSSAGTKTSKVKTRGWRRLRHCSSASTRTMGRRYKLLADVLC